MIWNLEVVFPDGRREAGEVASPTVRIGRDAENELPIDAGEFPKVSGLHATLELRADGPYVVPLSASYKTFVDGEPIHAPTALAMNSEVRLGDSGPAIRLLGVQSPGCTTDAGRGRVVPWALALAAVILCVLYALRPKSESGRNATPIVDTSTARILPTKGGSDLPRRKADPPDPSKREQRPSLIVPIGVRSGGVFRIWGSAVLLDSTHVLTAGTVADRIVETIGVFRKAHGDEPVEAAVRYGGRIRGLRTLRFHPRRLADGIECNVAIAEVAAPTGESGLLLNAARKAPVLGAELECAGWSGEGVEQLRYRFVEQRMRIVGTVTAEDGSIAAYSLSGDAPGSAAGGAAFDDGFLLGILFRHPDGWRVLPLESFQDFLPGSLR